MRIWFCLWLAIAGVLMLASCGHDVDSVREVESNACTSVDGDAPPEEEVVVEQEEQEDVVTTVTSTESVDEEVAGFGECYANPFCTGMPSSRNFSCQDCLRMRGYGWKSDVHYCRANYLEIRQR